MKYNIVKLDVTEHPKVIEFLTKGVNYASAITLLSFKLEFEKCNMFQDVGEMIYKDDLCHYFEVIKNTRIFRYTIETDQFEYFSFVTKNNFEHINQN